MTILEEGLRLRLEKLSSGFDAAAVAEDKLVEANCCGCPRVINDLANSIRDLGSYLYSMTCGRRNAESFESKVIIIMDTDDSEPAA